jgi:hypothetical protein
MKRDPVKRLARLAAFLCTAIWLVGCGGKQEEEQKKGGAPEGSNLGTESKKSKFTAPPAPPP